jgi:putative toxin-antitoxin system antitoxin component (TIGR02293 family)
MPIDVPHVVQVMGGQRTLGQRIRTISDLRHAVEAGLPVAVLDQVVLHVFDQGVGSAELKYGIVPKTTLHRRQRLTADESQHLERLARMTALAERVWGDQALAHEFLTSVQPQLDNERPVDLARSDLGTREVEDVLTRIEYALPV